MSEFTDNPKLASPGSNRKKLAQSEPKLVTSLVQLMDSTSLKVQCQAALALRNLASDGPCFRPPMCSPSAKSFLQRNTSSKSSRQTVYIPFSAFCSPLIFRLFSPPPPVCAMCPFILKTSRRSSSPASCNLLSTSSRSRTMKRYNATPSRRCATSPPARRRISSPSSKRGQCTRLRS
jgi:hypothetical protein